MRRRSGRSSPANWVQDGRQVFFRDTRWMTISRPFSAAETLSGRRLIRRPAVGRADRYRLG